jgi:hypothetical protein
MEISTVFCMRKKKPTRVELVIPAKMHARCCLCGDSCFGKSPLTMVLAHKLLTGIYSEAIFQVLPIVLFTFQALEYT